MMDATNSNPSQVVAVQKKRTWNKAQRTRLSEVFQSSKFITQRMINELAAEMGVSQMKVEIYFRAKRFPEAEKARKERERMRKNKRNHARPQATNALIPAIPAIAAIPAIRAVPAIPDIPAIPAIPAIPSITAIPAIPTVPAIPAMPMRTANNGPPVAVNPALGAPCHGAPMNWGNYQWGMATPPAMPSQNQEMFAFNPFVYGNALVGPYNANYAPPYPAQSSMNWNRGIFGYQQGYQPPFYAAQVDPPGICFCDGPCTFFR
ncbi:hypothetical protein B9Z55_022513 [Caenorhabditis nigoni]|uniref:Homeobox domain-containing protein n=1 Tax=Caenorhabditis nigoni TaxID=1611254 RepID=A0A2G5SL73_9PELO|nr:hypothetical protein B9Z55_022513 [Caenorhabditis nigoni]